MLTIEQDAAEKVSDDEVVVDDYTGNNAEEEAKMFQSENGGIQKRSPMTETQSDMQNEGKQ